MVIAATAILLMSSSTTPPAKQAPGYKAVPIPAVQVQMKDNVWAPRIKLLSEVTIDHEIQQCETTHRIENYVAAVGKAQGDNNHEGYYFNDSDVYKVIEGIAYLLALNPNPAKQKETQDLINTIVAAQEPDGYLYTPKQVYAHNGKSSVKPDRWVNIRDEHELYCAGHMYEAAVAWHEVTGDRTLLDASIKNADLVLSVFNDDGIKNPPGHQEIEIGLVRLWKATGNEKYLQQAKWFLDQRGRREGRTEPDYSHYAQDHLPVTEQSEAVGHAVRAAYQYMAMADIYAYLGEPEYAAALDRIWQSVNGTKLYITGGIGATGSGEAFGEPYELPNLTAYQETCATIANAMWNQRLFQLYGNGKYIDVMERALYNGLLSGLGHEGKSFFYSNPLASNGAERPAWYGCACCPPNVLRTIPSIPGWIYATGENKLYVNLYAANEANFQVGDTKLNVIQETRYPWDGDIALTLNPETESKFALSLRIPGWTGDDLTPSGLYSYVEKVGTPFILQVNGQTVEPKVENGYATFDRTWKKGDTVRLSLNMKPRYVVADDRVEANRGHVAVTMGPVVYCAEFPDQPDQKVFPIVLNPKNPLSVTFNKDLLGGLPVIETTGNFSQRKLDGSITTAGQTRPVKLVPYHAWANRGPGQMAVWLASDPSKAWPLPAPTIAATSKVTFSGFNDPGALNDQLEPANSDDHSQPRVHWWPRKDTDEWIQFEFDSPKTVKTLKVYWFDDEPRGGACRAPESWKVKVKVDGKWVEVQNPSGYPTDINQYCTVNFDPIKAEAIRIELHLQKDWASGAHEVIIE